MASETEGIRIPYKDLSEDALRGLIEEFVSREGTEYGAHDYSLDSKVATVVRQLERGEACIVFDTETQTCNIVVGSQ